LLRNCIFAHFDAQLARLGDAEFARGADKIAQVDQPLPDVVVEIAGQRIAAQHQLDRAGAIFQVGKAHLAHDADAAQTPGDADFGRGVASLCIQDARGGDGVCARGARRVRLDAGGDQAFQVFEARGFLVGQIRWVEQGMNGCAHARCSISGCRHNNARRWAGHVSTHPA
jgi:hypothetical protein